MTLHCDLCGYRIERMRMDKKTINNGILLKVHLYEQMTGEESEKCDRFIICKDCASYVLLAVQMRPSSELQLNYKLMSEYDDYDHAQIAKRRTGDVLYRCLRD